MAATASATYGEPAQKKQPSRKGRKAWRKNVDLTEVTTGLEDVRDQVISGGILSEKDAKDLFAIDVAGDATVDKQQQNKKLLKADEIVSLRSAVPGLDPRKRKATELAIPDSSSKRAKDGKYVSHKELQRLKAVADQAQREVAFELPTASHDPWGAQPPAKHAELEFVEQKQPKREPKTLRHAPVSLAESGKAFPSVPKPAGGKSYNPLVSDWSELLECEGLAAVEAEKSRLAQEASDLAAQDRAEAEARRVEAAEKDEWATDYESAWESEWEGIQSGAEDVNKGFTAKQQRRKTPAERNKIKARKEREAKARWEEKRKARLARKAGQPSRALVMQSLNAGISSDSEEHDNGIEQKLARRRFGQREVPAAPLEVVLPDELQDSLRRLKPEGNLLTDRYRNLLLNGKIEVRARQGQHKKRKVEKTEKWSYKDWKLK